MEVYVYCLIIYVFIYSMYISILQTKWYCLKNKQVLSCSLVAQYEQVNTMHDEKKHSTRIQCNRQLINVAYFVYL